MIPSPNTDPRISVLFLGAEVLKAIDRQGLDVSVVLEEMSSIFGVSFDHMMLALEWLFIIDAVFVDDGKVKLYEAA